MTVYVSTMVLNSLIGNGAKTIGGSLTSAEQSFYLGKLVAMLESWSLDPTMCYTVQEEGFALTAGDGSYTIGPSGDFNTARPSKILGAFIRDSSSSDSMVEVVDYDSFNTIINKTVSGSYPEYLHYDQDFSAGGLATITLYPLPKAGLTLYINSAKALQTFAAMSTALLMPPGYQRAIESNFTIETAPGLKSVQPEVIKIARESKALIQGMNLQDPVSRMDSGIVNRRTGNIIAGP